MFQPRLLILDEPTLGLDPLLQNMVYEILLDFHQKGTTIFMSSHNLAEVEKICSRVAIIKEGKLVATEEIANLKKCTSIRLSSTSGAIFESRILNVRKQG